MAERHPLCQRTSAGAPRSLSTLISESVLLCLLSGCAGMQPAANGVANHGPVCGPEAPAADDSDGKPRQIRVNVKPVYVPPIQELLAHYPRLAARKGIGGRVALRLDVEKDGSISAVWVLEHSGGCVFDGAAIDFARRYRFAPSDTPFSTMQEMAFALQ